MCEEREKIEATIEVSIKSIIDNCTCWDAFCSDTGLSPWCLNEGLTTGNDMYKLTLEQAKKHGII